MDFEKPDWDFWLKLPTVTDKQALILSFGICPDDFWSRVGFRWNGEPVPDSFSSTFNKRHRLLSAHLSNTDFFPTASDSKIRLADFAQWAVDAMQWEGIPQEIINLATQRGKEPAAVRKTELPSSDWRSEARKIAAEIYERVKKSGWTPTLDDISKKVMAEMSERGIGGARGIINNPNTIKRDALQGDKWWKHKDNN